MKDDAMIKIKVDNLIKVFSSSPKKAIELLRTGESKDKILKKTGLVVGIGGVSFHVYQGEILVIMGLSGSGKSTLLRCLNRLIEPSAGKILVDGEEVTAVSHERLREIRRKKFGMVFQRFALFPHRTVLQNVQYGLHIQGINHDTKEKKALEVLDLVCLNGWEDKYPAQLSGGMQQRVGLARALAVDPDILLMDEAFSALDPLIRKEMQDELITLHSRVPKTIIFITHDLDEAIKLGDRIILLKDGIIVQQGTPEEILTNPSDEYVKKFVQNVDISKVLTARGVMKDAATLAYLKDGPRTALIKMREAGISSIFVVNNEYQVQGIAQADDIAEVIKRGETSLTSAVQKDITCISPDTPVNDMFSNLPNIRFPIAVVDENKRLLGVIVKGSILSGLAGRGNE